MKSPRPKIHIIDVDEPLFAFHDLICRCLILLRNAEVKLMASADMQEYLITPIGICHDCRSAAPTTDVEKRHFCYYLVEGQEEKNFQPDRELEAVA